MSAPHRMYPCPACGTAIRIGAKACMHCGQSFVNGPPSPATGREGGNKGRLPVPAANRQLALGISLLTVGIIGFVFTYPYMQQAGSLGGQLSIGLSQSAAQQAQMAELGFYGSLAVGIVGLFLVLAGLVRR